MSDNEVQAVCRLAQQAASLLDQVLDACAMEAVFTDAVRLVEVIWQCIHVAAGGHGLMKGRVKDDNLLTGIACQL